MWLRYFPKRGTKTIRTKFSCFMIGMIIVYTFCVCGWRWLMVYHMASGRDIYGDKNTVAALP